MIRLKRNGKVQPRGARLLSITRFVLAGAAVAASMVPAAAQGVLAVQNSVQVQPGVLVQEISIGADGSVFALSATPASTAPSGVKNFGILRWNEGKGSWDSVAGEAYKIAVAPDGVPWVVTAQGGIWRWPSKSTPGFTQVTGGASAIAIGGDGSVYIVGGAPANGLFNNSIYKWNGSSWTEVGGTAMTVAVEPLGTPWALTSTGVVWRLNGDSRVGWAQVPGDLKMTHLAIGAGGQVWASGSDDVGGGNHTTYQWDGQKWVGTNAQTRRVGVAPDGRPWFVTAQFGAWRGEPQPAPMGLFGKVTPPPPPPPPPAAGPNDDICWKVTTTRGVGKVPAYCPQGTIEDATGYLCYPACQAGYNGIGPVCWDFPKSYGRGAGSIKDGCGIGKEYDTGLCYPDCPKNSSGVGPVCWGSCGGKYGVDCGAACAVSELQCGAAIVKMITSVAESAVSIFGMVVSGGATAAGTAAFRAAAKSAASAGVKAATKAGLKAYLIQQAKDLGRDLAEGEAESLAVSASENYLQSAAGGETGFDPATLDPTGIASVVQSFNKPMCEAQLISTVTPADPLTTINTTVFAIDAGNQLWANSGWAWMKVPNAANTSFVTVAHDGTIWRLDMAGKASSWNGSGWSTFGSSISFKEIATSGGYKVWGIGTNGTLYKFDGKQFMKTESALTVSDYSHGANAAFPMSPEHVSTSLDGTLYVSGRASTGAGAILRWEPSVEKFSTKFYGQALSTSISSSNYLYTVSADGQIATLAGTNILAGLGNSPQGVRAVAAGASGEIWYLDGSGRPNRVVKWTPGSGNLAPSIQTALFDTRAFKQIAIR